MKCCKIRLTDFLASYKMSNSVKGTGSLIEQCSKIPVARHFHNFVSVIVTKPV
jgi:hypothetical protein